MVYTQFICAECANKQIRRNGSSGGRAKYHCKTYPHQGYFQPAAVEKARQYAQVDLLLLEHNSLRSIVHLTGAARNTTGKWVKKRSCQRPDCPACGEKSGNASAVRLSNSMRCGRLSASKPAKSDCG